jgi:hypothetical protein
MSSPIWILGIQTFSGEGAARHMAQTRRMGMQYEGA